MSRLRLVAVFAVGLFAAPLAAEAQPVGKIARIGMLRPGSPPDPLVEAFRQGLRELGYVEGQNIAIEYRWAEGRTGRVAALASELAHLNLDVIVTQGEAAARSARAATHTIPIVMATSGDPIGVGLIASLPHPGGNVTGLSVMAPDITGKQMQLLKEAIPKVSRVAILYTPPRPCWPTSSSSRRRRVRRQRWD
jgi:putative ABC transport system substrate-binding protein